MEPTASDTGLTDRLRAVLPQNTPFAVHHVSTPPRKTDALYSAPPNERPDRTYCENHFLTISIDVPEPESGVQKRRVVVLGIEVLIYTTAHSTTLFVSKADSTGYLHLLGLKNTPSPIRLVCATFIDFLVAARRRPNIPLVVSLFARSQGQYLFPGSVDHGKKHVLDDRGLIKWWCRVLDPLIASASTPGQDVKGYLVIPGLDNHETRAFVPRTASWTLAHPLDKISHYTREFDSVPPRCLIPRFPDDPKSRFRDELDDEAGRSGTWRSVKSLDMFWDMMAFRQECSSGRMTGFIWVVFDEAGDAAPRKAVSKKPKTQAQTQTQRRKKTKIKLRGPIKPRQPKAKTEQRNYSANLPVHSAYYYWPTLGRGSRVVNEDMYKRIVELMLHLDFSTLDKAVASSRRWVKEVGLGSDWGQVVVGAMEPTAAAVAAVDSGGEVNNLSGLVKRKRAETGDKEAVNVLGAGLIKKKPKDEEVNTLTAGLVRKKPKAE
jgi:regulator of Ty1 transposition protein 109